MQHYAIADGLVAVVALYCSLTVLRRLPSDTARNFIVAGYLTVFAAAATGTVRFATGLVAELESHHSLLSAFSGSVGMGWFLYATASAFLPSASKPYSRILAWTVFPALFLIGLKFTKTIPLQVVVTGGVLIFALAASGILAFKAKKQKLAGLFIAAALVLSSLAGLRSNSLYGPDFAWHLYHTTLAAWLYMVSQAYLENDRSLRDQN